MFMSIYLSWLQLERTRELVFMSRVASEMIGISGTLDLTGLIGFPLPVCIHCSHPMLDSTSISDLFSSPTVLLSPRWSRKLKAIHGQHCNLVFQQRNMPLALLL